MTKEELITELEKALIGIAPTLESKIWNKAILRAIALAKRLGEGE